MTTLDLDAFRANIGATDFARPNMYRVIFNTVGREGEEDSIKIPGTFDTPTIAQRLGGRARDLIVARSELLRTVQGVYQPELANLITNGEAQRYRDLIFGLNSSRNAALMTKAVTLPSMSMTVENTDLQEVGRGYDIPTDRSSGSFSIEFYMAPNHEIRERFVRWMKLAVTGNRVINFRSSYISDIAVEVYDRKAVPQITYQMKDCFPISISELSLAWDVTDELLTFTVEFQFYKWATVISTATEDLLNKSSRIFRQLRGSTRAAGSNFLSDLPLI